MAIDIGDKDFDQQVLQSALPVVVDFWAPWCVPCNAIGSMIDRLSDQYRGRVKFCKMNVNENHDVTSRYHIMSLPTLLIFDRSQGVEQLIGRISENTLRSKLDVLV